MLYGSDPDQRIELKALSELSVRVGNGQAGKARSKGAALGWLAVMVTLHRDRGLKSFIRPLRA